MSNSINTDKFASSSVDWRSSIKRNSRRTTIVIGIFFLIYLSLGFLIDLAYASDIYPYLTLSQIAFALMTFQLPPLATVIMLTIAAISLWVSFHLYDRLMLLGTEYHEVTPDTARTQQEVQLYNVVEEMKIAAGLHFMPRVFIIEADYMNAFATGYSEKSAMVAITRGLMDKLTRSEMQAVMAHELSHVRHLDIKLTLMASLLSNLILMVLDIFFYNAMTSRNRSNSSRKDGLVSIIIILRYLLPIINVLLLLYLSRTREYMADAGCVELMRDNQPLASALLKIENDHNDNREKYREAYLQTPHENVRRAAYIFDPVKAGVEPVKSLTDFFSTHPNLASRLQAIGFTLKK